MTRKKYMMLALLVIATLSSCDLLEKNPPDVLSEALFWQSRADFDGAMVAVYAAMRTGSQWTAFRAPFLDNLTDNSYAMHEEGQYGMGRAITQGNLTPTTGGFVSGFYSSMYTAIARVNIFLDRLERYTNPDITQAQRDIFNGEALFFRAFFHSYLYRLYGNVPIVTEPLDINTMFKAKDDASLVIAQIHRDLDEAIRLLPDQTYVQARGRLTRNAARAFKARMLLNDAYDATGNAIPAVMTQALGLLNQISGYSLSPNFSDLFQGSGQGENPEIIFSAKYLAPNIWHSSDRELAYWNSIAPLTNFVQAFEFIDGTPFSVDDARFDPENPTANRDLRMAETVSFGRFTWNGHQIPQVGANPMPTGYQVSKFITRGDGSHFATGEWDFRAESDWVHLRYGDVLLMIAEAENELNGPTAVAHNAINALRERAGLPDLPAGLTREEMRERIRHERRIELAFEGSRYFDLRRWRIVADVINNLREPMIPAYTPRYLPHFNFWPLPQSQIDANNGVLVQNPGYL